MTAPTRPPRASQPYPVAENPEPEHTDGGWVSVLVAAMVAAVVIAVAGVIAGLAVVNLRESAMSDTARTTTTSTPVAVAPVGQIPDPIEITVATEVPAVTTLVPQADTLDQVAVESGVQSILTDSYGFEGVSDATCPAGQAIVVGSQFTCSVTVGGDPMSVSVTVTSTDGVYEVSRPY